MSENSERFHCLDAYMYLLKVVFFVFHSLKIATHDCLQDNLGYIEIISIQEVENYTKQRVGILFASYTLMVFFKLFLIDNDEVISWIISSKEFLSLINKQ